MNKFYKYFQTLLLSIALPLSILIASCGHQEQPIVVATRAPIQSLSQVLDLYEYKEPTEKKALEYLLQQAGIIAPESTLETHFPTRHDEQELLNDILTLVQETQKHFTMRAGTKERWEVTPATWMQPNNQTEIMTTLKRLKATDDVEPIIKHPDAICILGSTFKTMQTRLAYAQKLFDNGVSTKQFILLVGERKATINVDGNEEELRSIAEEYGINDLKKLTETHLGNKAYTLSKIYNKLPMHVIDTPAGNLPRPTTETTIMELTLWLRQHPEIKTVVFISNQPHVLYQTAVIAEVLKNKRAKINFEIVGPAIEKNTQTHSLIEALGAYIWAKTPSVIESLEIKIERDTLIKSFKALYEKNPAISKRINQLCNK